MIKKILKNREAAAPFFVLVVILGIMAAIIIFTQLSPGRDPDDTFLEVVNAGNCPEVQVTLIELNASQTEEISRKDYYVKSGDTRRIRINPNRRYGYVVDTSYGEPDAQGNVCFDIFRGEIVDIQAGTTTTINIPSSTRPRILLENVAECPSITLVLRNAANPSDEPLELTANSGETSEEKDMPSGAPENQVFEYTLEPAESIEGTDCSLILTGVIGPTEFNRLYRVHVTQGVSSETID
jgi:hypothetical protein